jgi:hypothetical protein
MKRGSNLNSLDNSRCPAIERLPLDLVHTLHRDLTLLVRLRRGVEMADIHIQRSRQVAEEAQELLGRLRRQGF